MPVNANTAPMPPPAPAQQSTAIPLQTIDFNTYVDKVHNVYNKYSSSSSSEEYNNSFDATSEIEAIVKTIRAQAFKVSFAGKQDAINAIAEIALEILDDGGSTLSSEIRKGFYWESAGDAIERIIDGLSREEILVLRRDGDLVRELDGLKESAAGFGLDVGLDGAMMKITGSASDGEEEEEEEGGPSQPPTVSKSASAFGQTAAVPLVVG